MDLMMPWRLVVEDGVDDAYGLATDDAMTGRVGRGLSAPILRLYTYRPCALVGRFQTIGNELRLERCEARGMPVNRRPTGGGAIVMGPDQLGVALMLPGGGGDAYAQARERMARFSAGICRALAGWGIQAVFRGKNDVEVGGRKIAGLGIFRHPQGGLLFHASLLVGLDVPLMLDVLNTPFEKITDKEIATVAARTSTVRRECGQALSLPEVRARVAEGYVETFGVTLEESAITAEEREAIRDLEQEKYRSHDWIFQSIALPDAFGAAKRKTPGGLLDVRVTLAGTTIKSVLLGGDFFAGEGAVADLEARLRWHPSHPRAVEKTLRAAHAQHAADLAMLPVEALVETVQEAVSKAGQASAREQLQRYGCFVNPQGA
jgi:lipoate-protein ligase A